MSNYNHTELTCNDAKRFAKIMKGVTLGASDFELKDGTAFIESRNSLPLKEIKQLSKDNPGLIFTAKHSLESENYDTIYIEEYKNGKSRDVKVEPQYMISSVDDDIKEQMGESYKKLLNKGIEIFEHVDILKVNENGRQHIEFVNDIILIVEDEDFQMHLSKKGSNVSIKCFEKRKIIDIELHEIILQPF